MTSELNSFQPNLEVDTQKLVQHRQKLAAAKDRKEQKANELVHAKEKEEEKEIPLEIQVSLLKKELKLLKNLPSDFRDCDPCSDEWGAFWKLIPAKRKEMAEWLKGPVLCIGNPPNAHEIAILGKGRSVIHLPLITPQDFTYERLCKFLDTVESEGYSHIYITRPFPRPLAKALNVILSLCKSKVRAITEFEDSKGERLR